MKSTLLLLSCLIFLLFNCTDTKQNKIKNATCYGYEDFGVPIILKGEIIIDSVWKPKNIWCEDSLLVLAESKNDYFVDIYHKDKRYKIAENIRYGIGPDEQLNCWSLQFNSQLVWAFDMQAGAITAYPKNSFLTQSHVLPEKRIQLSGEGSTGLVCLSNGLLVSSSLADTKHLLSVYNQDGIKDTSKVILYPEIHSLSLSENAVKRIFEHRIYYHESSEKIVLFYVYMDLIDIYDKDLHLLARIHGPDQFIPELGIADVDGKQHVHTIKGKTKFAYLSGCLTTNEIWTLYYGIYPERGKELQNRVFVYDYTGKPLRRYQLEYPVFALCVDENNKVIYGLSEQPEPCVIKFAIQ